MKKNWFSKLKLDNKFTIIIGIIVFIPTLIVFLLLFSNMRSDAINQTISNLKNNMNETSYSVQKTVDLCNTSTQVILNYQNLTSFLIKLDDKDDISTTELVDFYQNDIGMLERLVNSNPYLYQIRVYANSSDFSEMIPILYSRDRMLLLNWSKHYESGEWQFDYKDMIFTKTVNSSQHTLGLITSMTDYEHGEIGVIEVAVRMETIFPEIFQSTNDDWTCFVDKNGNIYSDKDNTDCKWEQMKQSNVDDIAKLPLEEQYYETKIADDIVVVGILPIKELSGYMIRIVNMNTDLNEIDRTRTQYIAILTGIFALTCVIIKMIVKAILKQFYRILSTVREIQNGDLDARIATKSSDEMGELGTQINKMLDNIQHLISENIKRELLMTNSEIKALQNQINAHFIYNVLESIKMMAEIDEKYAISDAVTSLGKLLRYGMKWSTKNVTVGQEIDYIKNYLELINLRFDYEIHLALNISEFIYKQEIPKMSLQPIVENAIYHGIEELAEDASIYIKAILENDSFIIEITDSGCGMSEEELVDLDKKINGEIETGGGSGNGIGLKNVQDRIHISFGDEYGISISSKLNCYTKVIVKLPITHKEGNQYEEAINCRR